MSGSVLGILVDPDRHGVHSLAREGHNYNTLLTYQSDQEGRWSQIWFESGLCHLLMERPGKKFHFLEFSFLTWKTELVTLPSQGSYEPSLRNGTKALVQHLEHGKHHEVGGSFN